MEGFIPIGDDLVNIDSITTISCNETRCDVYRRKGTHYTVTKKDDPASFTGLYVRYLKIKTSW